MCAEDIVDSRWHLRLDDIDLALRRARQGEYALKMEFKIDTTDIFKILDFYEAEKLKLKHNMKSQEAEANMYQLFDNPVMKKILTEVTEKLSIKESKPAEPYVAPEKHPITQQIEAEWDELRKTTSGKKLDKSPRALGLIDLVVYKKKPMAFTEFYSLRFEELAQEIGMNEPVEQPTNQK